MTEMMRRGMHPMQLSVIAGASLDVIIECYVHLTKDDAYNAIMRARKDRAGRRRGRPNGEPTG